MHSHRPHLALVLAAAALAPGPLGSSAAAPARPPPGAAPEVRTGPEVRPAAASAQAPPLWLLAPVERRSGEREAPEPKRIPRAGPRASPVRDPVLQAPAPGPLAPTVGVDFLGLGRTLGLFTVNSIPPDTNGAVGPNHYVQMVNTDVAVFNKTTGAVLSSASFAGAIPINQLFTPLGGLCAADNDGDPVVLYDQLADRWLLSQFAVCSPTDSTCSTPLSTYYECVAVSKGPDPTGGYWLYAFDYPQFPDYPKLGVWPDAWYASFNLFDSSNAFAGPLVCAYDRTKMLAGQTPTQQCFAASTAFGSPLPASVDGSLLPPAGAPNLLLTLGASDGQLAAFKFHVDWTTPASSTFTGPIVLGTAAYTLPCGDTGATCVVQPSTTIKLDTLGDRLMFRNAYRNFGDHQAWVTNHTVDVGGNHSGVRWYELWLDALGNPRLYQQATWAPDAAWRWMGSVAQDQAGNLAAGYSVSSGAIRPDLRVAGRLATDAAGTFTQAETSLVTGVGSQTGSTHTRWGDYSAMVVDPSDDCTFWFTSQYLPASGSFNWDTRIASFKLPGCPAASDFSLQVGAASGPLAASGTATFTVTTAITAGAAQAAALAAFGLPAGVSAAFSPASLTGAGTSTLTLTATAGITAGAASFFVTATGLSAFHAAPAQVTLSTVRNDFGLSIAPASRTMTSGSTAAFTVGTTVVSGTAEAVTLAVSGLPAGVTGAFSPVAPVAGSPSTLTLTAAANAAAASQAFTVSGASASASHAVSPSPTVTVASDFSLSLASGTVTLPSGTSAGVTVNTAVSSGSAQSIALSVSGLPAGVTGAFNPTSVTAGQPSVLTLTAAAGAAGASQVFTVTGTAASGSHAAGGTVTIPDDFSLALAPSAVTVGPGGSATATVSTGLLSGSAETIALAVTGLPAGVSGSFSPASLQTGQSATLTLGATTAAALGSAGFTVTGTSAGAIHTAAGQLTVAPDFTLALSPPAAELLQGGSVPFAVNTTAVGGPLAVALSIAGLPAGVTFAFAPATVASGGSSLLTLTASASAAPGTAVFTVTGTAATGSHQAVGSVTVPDDFALQLTPAALLLPSGTQAPVAIALPITSGAAVPVALSITAPLPAGITAAFAPASLDSGGASTLTLSADPAAPASHAVLSVSAVGPQQRTRTASLTLDVPSLFSIALSPASVQLSGGESVTLDLTSAITSGSPLAISFAARDLPAGVTAAFTPATLLSGQAGQLTLTAAADARAADQDFAVDATGYHASASATSHLRVVVPPGDFSLSVGAASGPLRAGGSVACAVSTAQVSGAPQLIALSASGLPPGVTAAFQPAVVHAGEGSTLTLSGATPLPGAGGPFVVSGASGAASHSAAASVAIASDFSLAATPAARTLKRGQSAAFAVTTAVASGAPETLALAATGLPPGVSAAFDPAALPAGGSSTLTLTAAADAPPVVAAPFAIAATAPGAAHSAAAQVSVEADDFSLALTPASRAISAGGSAGFAVTTALVSGNPQPLAFSVAGLPPGVTAAFEPPSTAAGGSAVLTLTAAGEIAGGTATFTVTAAGPSATHAAQAQVSVGNEFRLAIAPAGAVLRGGGAAAFTVSTTVASGSAEAITLSVAGLPAGVTGSFSQAAIASGGSATLTLAAAGDAPGGTSSFTVTAAAPSASHAAQAQVTVPDDWSLALAPAAATVAPGATAAFQVTVARTSGSAVAVALAASGLPAGVTASFAPASVLAGGGAELVLTAAADATPTPAQGFSVTGTAAGQSRSADGLLAVSSSDFTLALSPAQVLLRAGGSTSLQVATTAAAGAPDEIALSAAGLPARVGAAFAPPSVLAGQPATVTLTAPADLAAGGATLTVTGTTRFAARSATAALVLLAPPQVSITTPAAGALLSGTVELAAAASASTGTTLARVDFAVDGALVATSSGAPAGVRWDSTAAADGPHTLTAIAGDAAGGSATSAPVAISVLNRAAVRGGCGGCAGSGYQGFALLGLIALVRARAGTASRSPRRRRDRR